MKSRLFSSSIQTFDEYRQAIRRLAELLAEDPTLDSTEAEDLLDLIARYMVEGGHLEPTPANDFLRSLGDDDQVFWNGGRTWVTPLRKS